MQKKIQILTLLHNRSEAIFGIVISGIVSFHFLCAHKYNRMVESLFIINIARVEKGGGDGKSKAGM